MAKPSKERGKKKGPPGSKSFLQSPKGSCSGIGSGHAPGRSSSSQTDTQDATPDYKSGDYAASGDNTDDVGDSSVAKTRSDEAISKGKDVNNSLLSNKDENGMLIEESAESSGLPSPSGLKPRYNALFCIAPSCKFLHIVGNLSSSCLLIHMLTIFFSTGKRR